MEVETIVTDFRQKLLREIFCLNNSLHYLFLPELETFSVASGNKILKSTRICFQGNYKVYNLCSEQLRDASILEGKVHFTVSSKPFEF